jgi:hypothetical protein
LEIRHIEKIIEIGEMDGKKASCRLMKENKIN